ncbi:MAG: Hsp70 family protein [Myxococcota bacterium]
MSTTDTPARFTVGIDLGTTNTTLSFIEAEAEGAVDPTVLPIPQVVHASEVGSLPMLPSFAYLPAAGELPSGAIALPWDPNREFALGAFARERGAQVPGRVVSSAKSWLSHGAVDRRGAILPWQAADDVEKISPVTASARYLEHLREAWDSAHPDAPLASQDIVLTVPASFDPVARQLTEEAARAAGLGARLTLLEEPTAAVYAWLAQHGEGWRKQVEVGDVVLVCDIGGGTTDFSLITVAEDQGNLVLERVAVGDHILLGGDNMDLALAYTLQAQLEAEGKNIDDWQLRALTHGCRGAKERLLENGELAEQGVVIPGRGKKLIGGSLKVDLTRETLNAVLVEGFFPAVAATDRPAAPKRMGITEVGLPYASDAAITRHLAAFLGRQAADDGRAFRHPTAMLFNGGVTRSVLLRDRLLEIVNGWLTADGGQPLKVLPGVDPDLAVSRGAAYFGRVRLGRGVRIKGGTARSYYIGIERAGLAVPGVPPRFDAVCVAPFGMEEGSEAELQRELGLVVGEPAAFRFFSSTERKEDRVGDEATPRELTELDPIETTLAGDVGQVVPARLRVRVTEVGTLEIAAVESASGRRHRLEFNVRVE